MRVRSALDGVRLGTLRAGLDLRASGVDGNTSYEEFLTRRQRLDGADLRDAKLLRATLVDANLNNVLVDLPMESGSR